MQSFRSATLIRPLIFALPLMWLQDGQAQTDNLNSQRQALNGVGQALSWVVVKAKKVTGQLNYGFYEEGCLFGVLLRPGSSATESFQLKAGQSYLFIGSGDKTARNVDIILRDSKGVIVGKDTEADSEPFVLFKPKTTGKYTMSLQLKSGWRGSAFCAVTLLRKGGYDLPLERIVQAAIKTDYASMTAFRKAKGGRFNQEPNTWGLYGAVIRPGRSISSDPKVYKSANRGLIAVGDSSIRALDLALLDKSKKSVVKSARSGASAEITHEMSEGTYSVSIANKSSSGPALVMAVLLELPAKPVNQHDEKPSKAPTALSTQTEGASPFAGNWKGDWANEKQRREGTFKILVQPDGSLTGRLYNPTLDISTKFEGTVSPNGALRLIYSRSRQNYVVEGNIQFADEPHTKAEGRVSFSTLGTVLGTADFLVAKDK